MAFNASRTRFKPPISHLNSGGNGATVSLFGHTALVRQFCERCGSMSIVLNGYFQCCDRPVKVTTVSNVERVSESYRGRLSAELKRKILVLQKHRCHYCGLDLSRTWYYMDKWGDYREIKINYDHFIPVSFAAVESLENLYAVCNLCNKYKANKMFITIDECRKYLVLRKRQKGIWKLYSADDVQDFESK